MNQYLIHKILIKQNILFTNLFMILQNINHNLILNLILLKCVDISYLIFSVIRKKKLFQKYNQRRIQNKNNKNNLENNEDDLSISNINDNNEKNQIEINDNLEDDDGLNEYDANPLEKFFTLRRIVDMYGNGMKVFFLL